MKINNFWLKKRCKHQKLSESYTPGKRYFMYLSGIIVHNKISGELSVAVGHILIFFSLWDTTSLTFLIMKNVNGNAVWYIWMRQTQNFGLHCLYFFLVEQIKCKNTKRKIYKIKKINLIC